jgi:hypothetical protein
MELIAHRDVILQRKDSGNMPDILFGGGSVACGR